MDERRRGSSFTEEAAGSDGGEVADEVGWEEGAGEEGGGGDYAQPGVGGRAGSGGSRRRSVLFVFAMAVAVVLVTASLVRVLQSDDYARRLLPRVHNLAAQPAGRGGGRKGVGSERGSPAQVRVQAKAVPSPPPPPPPPPPPSRTLVTQPRPHHGAPDSFAAPEAPPAAQAPASKLYIIQLVGTWFGGEHHWFTGPTKCPNACRIEMAHHTDHDATDVFLLHGATMDVANNAADREYLRSEGRAHRPRLLMAAEFFPDMAASTFLDAFNGEMSYRVSATLRDVQYALAAMSAMERVQAAARAGAERGVPLMSLTWLEAAGPILPVERRRTAPDATITWASTYCDSPSGREVYIKALMRAIPVEVYSNPCLANAPPERASLPRWEQEAAWRTFKFHLSFENRLGDDYVTEKFYSALARGQVPIYFGARNIELHAPARDSYIDVRDFATPAHLAAHLAHLDANATAYYAYHAWRRRPFSTYGSALRAVIADALPYAAAAGVNTTYADGSLFRCAICAQMQRWDDAGRPLRGTVPPFKYEPRLDVLPDNFPTVYHPYHQAPDA